jgi:hypothetical protein
MAKVIKIEFLNQPVVPPIHYLNFDIRYLSNIFIRQYSFSFTPINSSEIEIGTTMGLTILNVFNKLSFDISVSVLSSITTVVIQGDNIFITLNPLNDNDVTFTGDNISTRPEINIIRNYIGATPVLPLALSLIRSRYSLRFTPQTGFDSIELSLKNYIGNKNTVPAENSFTLSKNVVRLGQEVMSFDLNKLIENKIINNISNYTLSGFQFLEENNSCWTRYNAIVFNNNVIVRQYQGEFFNLYGYGYTEQGSNPFLQRSVLFDGDYKRHYQGNSNRIYFLTKDLTSVTYKNAVITIPAYDLNLNSNYIGSIDIKDYEGLGDGKLIFNYENENIEIDIEIHDECRHDVKHLVFINKNGVPESIFFSKIFKKEMNVKGKDFRAINDNFGIINPTQHVYKSLNVNAKEKFQINTDYLNEVENESIKQLMLSESVWLIENGVVKPIKLDKEDVQWKTTSVDKLIQYTLSFEYAYDVINT